MLCGSYKELKMQIIARCPWCGHTWRLKGAAVDRRVLCLSCKRLFKVPHLDDVPKAKKVIEGAHGAVYVDEKGKTYG